MGADTIAWTKVAGQPFTFRAAAEVDLRPGQTIAIGFDPARGSVFAAEAGNRL
jgi:multiple sugar transport system ATP-binding protein